MDKLTVWVQIEPPPKPLQASQPNFGKAERPTPSARSEHVFAVCGNPANRQTARHTHLISLSDKTHTECACMVACFDRAFDIGPCDKGMYVSPAVAPRSRQLARGLVPAPALPASVPARAVTPWPLRHGRYASSLRTRLAAVMSSSSDVCVSAISAETI